MQLQHFKLYIIVSIPIYDVPDNEWCDNIFDTRVIAKNKKANQKINTILEMQWMIYKIKIEKFTALRSNYWFTMKQIW